MKCIIINQLYSLPTNILVSIKNDQSFPLVKKPSVAPKTSNCALLEDEPP